MGAGDCPWGGFTNKMYAIYMERYASHRAVARCFGQGLFSDLALHFASHTDPQPKPPYHSKASPLSSYNIWQNAKHSWRAAKSTPPDPYRSQLTLYLTSVTKIGPEKAHFRGYLTLGPLTFDLQSQKNQSFTAETFLHAKYGGHRSNSSGSSLV